MKIDFWRVLFQKQISERERPVVGVLDVIMVFLLIPQRIDRIGCGCFDGLVADS